MAGVLVSSAAAEAQPALVSGQLTDAGGRPTAGAVRVYAWPNHDRAATLPLVGQAQTDASGRFTVYGASDAQLVELALQREGWLDFIAVGDTGD